MAELRLVISKSDDSIKLPKNISKEKIFKHELRTIFTPAYKARSGESNDVQFVAVDWHLPVVNPRKSLKCWF